MDCLESHPVPSGVDTDSWTLDVRGVVERPLSLHRGDLTSHRLETHTGDFECVDGWAVTGLAWRGVRVGDLLDRTGPGDGVEYALVHAMDGDYACLFSLTRVADAVLAVELDDEPLPVEHGGPARLVPTDGGDCWESVKWVTEIELVESKPNDRDTAEDLALSRTEPDA